MNTVYLSVGVVVFAALIGVRPPLSFMIRSVVILLFFHVFFLVLAKSAGLLGQLSSLSYAVAVGTLVAGMATSRYRWRACDSNVRKALFGLGVLIMAMFAHNLARLSDLLEVNKLSETAAVNPWGLTVFATIWFFLLSSNFRLDDDPDFQSFLRKTVIVFSVLFFLINVLVMIGYIAGNTTKLREGVGGKGFANLSTNETGLLGLSLMLWNLIFLVRSGATRRTHALCMIMNFFTMWMAQSRIALGLAGLLFLIFFMVSGVARKTKSLVILPLFLLFLFFSGNVILQRTLAEEERFSDNPLMELPGSGRPMIWFYYLDAFIYTSDLEPSQWVFGSGMLGLVDLYQLTPLEEFGLVLDKVHFYPLHSDWMNVFLSTGFLGLVSWFVFVTRIIKVSWTQRTGFAASGGVAVTVLFTLADMMSYAPLQTTLAALAVTSSPVDRRADGADVEAS